MLSIISFVGFTLLVAVIAWYSTRKTNENTADGYYLGGRSLGAITIAGSLLLTNLSAEQIVGLNGQSFTEGILVMAWETLAAIALIITAIWFLPKYMKKGITTIPASKNAGRGKAANGGGGGNGNYRLGNRKALDTPKPKYQCDDEGRVVVKIYVDRRGIVTRATPGERVTNGPGTTTASK